MIDFPAPWPYLCDKDDIADNTVYLHLDSEGRVLYVGCSRNVAQRSKKHASRSRWWPEVVEVREVGTWTRRLALGVEKGLIVQYDPPGNYVHTPPWRLDMFDRKRGVERVNSRAVTRPLSTAASSEMR